MTDGDVARRVAANFDSRFLRSYVRTKIDTDPLYRAVLERLRGHEQPLLDVGCGVGVLSFFLREHGLTMPVIGIDHDGEKIEVALRICERYPRLGFVVGDARARLQFRGSVLLLDLLHYFDETTQQLILGNVADVVPPGGMVIIRDALRDGSWRYRATYAQETLSRLVRWLKAERLHFATHEQIAAPFRERGFSEEVMPMWGRTPFNNYLFVFRREAM